jgi:hypothetical protein
MANMETTSLAGRMIVSNMPWIAVVLALHVTDSRHSPLRTPMNAPSNPSSVRILKDVSLVLALGRASRNLTVV